MVTNHDQLMKELIARFPDQFVGLAAPEIASQIDFGSLFFEPEEHYVGSPTGHARRGDLVARAPTRSSIEGACIEEKEVLLHVEIELQNRTSVEPRLLRYHRGLSLKHGLAVHTTVLFLRGGPAGSRARVYEERSLGVTVGAIGYHSLGLSQASSADYLARQEPLAWALAALMRPKKGQSRSQLGLACVVRIAGEPEIGRDERGLLLGCVLTYADFEEDDATEFDRIIASLNDEEVQDVRMSMTERWRKQGLEKGLEKGRKEGRAEGARDLVIKLLGQKFGDLSVEVERRVDAITSPEELVGLAEKMFQADSLEELGLA